MMKTIFVATVASAMLAISLGAQTAGAPKTVNGLQVSVAKIERMEKASLKDCPPGTNTVNAVQRPGDELAVVTVNFKVMPDFKPAMFKRPTATATDDKVYNTSVQFVEVGSVPEYSCQFIYRVPQGTKLKAFTVEGTSFDVAALDK
jgi:hypothetical protein